MTPAARLVDRPERGRLLGADAEDRARRALEAIGWRTLDANFRVRGGEIDLVMDDHGTVVFVEVRHRTGAAHGGAAESLGARKRSRVRRAATLWLARHAPAAERVRFDAVLLDGPLHSARLTHLRDAF